MTVIKGRRWRRRRGEGTGGVVGLVAGSKVSVVENGEDEEEDEDGEEKRSRDGEQKGDGGEKANKNYFKAWSSGW